VIHCFGKKLITIREAAEVVAINYITLELTPKK